MLSADQLHRYERDGFVVLEGHIPEADIVRVEEGFARNPPRSPQKPSDVRRRARRYPDHTVSTTRA